MPDKDGDDEKKSTKSVVNKKQKPDIQTEGLKKIGKNVKNFFDKTLKFDSKYSNEPSVRSGARTPESTHMFKHVPSYNKDGTTGVYGQKGADFVKDKIKKGSKSLLDKGIEYVKNNPKQAGIIGAAAVGTGLAYTGIKGLQKRGERKAIAKSVVRQLEKKKMMGEEGYDIARDMGKVRPSKDKKDATTMPPSKEMEKTRKVVKGPSALERVKAKYGKSVMKVGKKKVKEELDLTKVAEAFGGYIVNEKLQSLTGNPEEISRRIKKAYSKTRKTKQDAEAADQAAEMSKKRGEFAKSFGGDSIERPERLKTKMAKNIAKQDIEKTGDKFVGGSKSGTRKKKGIKFGDAPGAGPVKIIQPAKTKAQKEAELEGKRKDYLDPKTNKASPEGVKKYITKARQMRSGSNVPVDQETTDNIAKIAGKEYADKINQKYGGRRAGKRKSTATPPAFATRTGESGGPLPVSMRNRRVPKTSSLSTPVTTTPTFKSFQDRVKTVTPEVVG